jgi:hypothetical protein
VLLLEDAFWLRDEDRAMRSLMTSVMSNEGWKAKRHFSRLVAERDEQSFKNLVEQRVGKAVAGWAKPPWLNEDQHRWLSKKLAQLTIDTDEIEDFLFTIWGNDHMRMLTGLGPDMERIAKDIRIVRFRLAKKFDETDDALRRGYEAYFGEEGATAE